MYATLNSSSENVNFHGGSPDDDDAERSPNSLSVIDVPEDKAVKAAAALGKRDDDVGTLKSDMNLLKWMMGFVLAFQIGIFVKLFVH
ncbi:hypothetical protein IGS68_19045 [Skermanella sp. TT6]|uniref:Uncharacterized protein n=1 Tax=Skermanella cutis TaxID=2775420 RepID=A0ABX7B6N8_9PROT|nr:hypothetical protein [Skermanella sp. TT6]QQP88141.1 hypothetical protein IGS68_19045 [Skermanella sp. TT6]